MEAKTMTLPNRHPDWNDEQWRRVVDGCTGFLPPVPDWAYEAGDPLLADDPYLQGYWDRVEGKPFSDPGGHDYAEGWKRSDFDMEVGHTTFVPIVEVSDAENR